jgi:hypothetical protein
MRKHILGFALFSLIFAAFALVYAFFYAPSIPPKEAVKPPIAQTETQLEKPISCDLKKNKYSVKVISSRYLVDEGKIVSQIRVSLNKNFSPSEMLFVRTNFTTGGKTSGVRFSNSNHVKNPFAEENWRDVTVVSNVPSAERPQKNENLYVTALVSDEDVIFRQGDDITEAKSVLFVYGRNSIIER